MPMIEVTTQQGTLSQDDRDALMSRLSDAVLSAEGAPLDSAGAQSLVWAWFRELPPGSVYVGGKTLASAPLRVAVTTPAGALNDSTRATLVASIGAIVDDIVGAYEGRLNHWVMLSEISDGCWGGAGNVFRLGDIQAAMDIRAA
jgi:phenylpyruvate tautomerase PptA (4-oxalocrotonate tautomerase family)